MCLLLTDVAAIICYLAHLVTKKNFFLRDLFIIYASATIIWSVDMLFLIIEGEPPLDLSLDDTKLGLLVLFFGLVLALAIKATKTMKTRFA